MLSTIRSLRESKCYSEIGIPCLTVYVEALAVWPYSNKDYVEAVFYFVEEYLEEHPSDLDAVVLKADLYTKLAWKIRGSGWASTVKDEDRAGFLENLNTAKTILDNVPDDQRTELWYEKRTVIARGLGEVKTRTKNMVRKGIERYPHYDMLLRTYAVNLTPRWGGSHEELRATIRELTGDIEDGDIAYARVAWAQLYFLNGDVYKCFDESRVLRGLEVICARFPHSLNYDITALFYCLAGNKAKALDKFEQADGQQTTNWRKTGRSRSEWIAWAMNSD